MNVLVSIYSDIPTWNIPDGQVQRMRERAPRHRFVHARTAEETDALAADADVAFSSLVRASTLAVAPRLTWVHSPAAGVGSLLFPEMLASSVVLTNSRGMHAQAMAEHVIGMVIALFRKFPEAFAHQAARRWGHAALTEGRPTRVVAGSFVGVVGPGGVGAAIAKLAAALGATVDVVRRHPEQGAPPGARAVYPASRLIEKLPEWDVVVLAAPLTRETRGMIGAPELRAMKPDAVLVNVGRGKLVREADLVEALREGTIGGAALDVFEHEPLDATNPLWDLPNVLVTPHVSGFRSDYWDLATDLFLENLRRFDAGEPLLNVVDKTAGY
jgi:phosphoglycerate dehydrogenase-like enzyme